MITQPPLFDLPSAVSFQVSARTMQMLGRENVSSPIVALIEAIKNSYDAGASTVLLYITNASKPEGIIRILDDGDGMTLEDLKEKWMVISTDNKKIANITRVKKTGKKRVQVGEKGIGRLALDRLAQRTTIITKHEGHRTLKLDIDWTRYENTKELLDEVEHPLSAPPDLQSSKLGTEVVLTGLRDIWTQKMYRDLHSDLSLLVPPFELDDVGFEIYFDCNEAPDLSGTILNPMPAAAEYKLISTLDAEGTINHVLTYQPTGEISVEKKKWWEALDVAPGSLPACGPLKFMLYFYLRVEEKKGGLKELGITTKDVRNFLEKYQGIRIYRDSFRVKPYGDPSTDEDWLGLNARRVSHPGGVRSRDWRLAENQVVGTVLISREQNPDLEDQTNREGLVQNQAYLDLRTFIVDSGIRFLERERIERKRREAGETETDPRTVVTAVTSDLGKVSKKLREDAQKIQDKDSVAASRLMLQAGEMERLSTALASAGEAIADVQTEKQMMIGLATLGIAVAAFGHETIRDVNDVLDRASLLEDPIQHLPSKQRKEAVADLKKLQRSAERVSNWGHFALERIRRSKRIQKEIEINSVIEDILHTFKYTLDELNIDYSELHLPKSLPSFRGFEMDIESILINFITNSIAAMRFTPTNHRKIQIGTSHLEVEEAIRVRFADSGKGIPEDDVQKVFSPLFSTKVDAKGEPIGTGMGLTIVKDIVASYGGEIKVKGRGRLGGAEFEVALPIQKPQKAEGEDDNEES